MEKEIKIPKIEFKVRFKNVVSKKELFQIKDASDAYQAFKTVFDADSIDWIEEALMLCLSKDNRVIGYFKIGQGGTDSVIMDPKVIFTIALQLPTSGIIVAHNHPSGNLKASDQDIWVSKKIVAAGKSLEINVLDSMIITNEGYLSLNNEGLL